MSGFGLIIPLLPYYAKEFGASDILMKFEGRISENICSLYTSILSGK